MLINTCPQNYKFQGKERDTETGLDDFGARYFSSSYGRWLSPDWSAVPVPVPYADLTNPQTLNLYQFVGNNPETLTDALGHAIEAMSPLPGPGCNLNACSEEEMLYGERGTAGTGFALPTMPDPIPAQDPPQAQQSTQPASQQGEAQNQPASGEGSQANLARRAAIAATAESYDGNTSMPYTPGHPTCNLFVQEVIAESGAPKPEIKKKDGTTGAPGAAEWAGSKIPNFRILKPGEKPLPGDVAAYALPGHRDYTGHSGIVVSVSKDGVVRTMAAHPTVIGPDYKFQPGVATYQRYIGP